MEIVKILDDLKSRVPWYSIKPIFRSHQIDVAQGWDQSIVKILHDIKEKPARARQIVNLLTAFFEEQLLCGEKLIQFHRLPSPQLAELVNQFKNYQVNQSVFSKHLPFPIPSSELEANIGEFSIVDVIQDQVSIKVLICSVLYYNEMVALETSDLKDQVVSDYCLSEHTEVIIKRRACRQFYDVVTFNAEKGLLEFRLDWGLGMKQTDAKRSISRLTAFFQAFVKQAFGVAIKLDEPINFFPLIEKTYNDARVGKVCELSYTVNSGSIKSDKLRRHDIDIRNEIFHKAGREAVDGHVSPYKIAIAWSFRKGETDSVQPELLLPGRKEALNCPESNPLNFAIIKRCFYEKDFQEILKVLLQGI